MYKQVYIHSQWNPFHKDTMIKHIPHQKAPSLQTRLYMQYTTYYPYNPLSLTKLDLPLSIKALSLWSLILQRLV
jgi:hypothetical protein